MRMSKLHHTLKRNIVSLPGKEHKPLTQVEEFNLHVEHRAVDRIEFDRIVKVREVKYERHKEEAEASELEEERALKMLRRAMVPHARPVPNLANPYPTEICQEYNKGKTCKYNGNSFFHFCGSEEMIIYVHL
ncbi:hypothetical protein Nepgr_011989 [Nepenthes gracilis]|uniref:TPX2 C-terminal domain-containing protein n=1 Tax=Nepenthes gracilis TaxID=150966 RepID=A0AAD3SFB6_NEPGR|nr:hypothetical protein Nepgr_011989 [Nepenthes gracilis]